MSDLSNEVRDLLNTSYPEIANATLRERDENGLHVVELLPQSVRRLSVHTSKPAFLARIRSNSIHMLLAPVKQLLIGQSGADSIACTGSKPVRHGRR
ncbi:MAG: hypothetical protein IPK17_34715 [Chloroflexi bacterium]|uniref:hypothetical protein n=1 Tax=Candidatus Flexifilum breve TaxID=3140694 RepID=UPI003134F2CA|nr:hypothetical protein [Chloroflexota bacterium]